MGTENEDTGRNLEGREERGYSELFCILTGKFLNTPGHQTTLSSQPPQIQNDRHKMPGYDKQCGQSLCSEAASILLVANLSWK